METARAAIAEACGAPPDGPGSPRLSCRFTHVYPDGPAPYYTVLCPAVRGGEVEQWDEVKAAVSERVIDAGGTITHHHAVGRDHRPWYDRQRPDPFAEASARGEAGGRPRGRPQPRGPPRPLTFCAWRRLTEERPPAPGVPRRPPRRSPGRSCWRCWSRCARRNGSRTCSCSPDSCSPASSMKAPRSSTPTLAFTAFCAISSAGYLFNDLRDAAHDRQHPEKRLRPIASGELSAATAWVSAATLAAIGVAVALIGVSAEVAGLVALYGVITAAYSLVLKRLVILDVMTIASLFLLRVVAGAVAVEAARLGVAAALHGACWPSSSASPSAARRRCPQQSMPAASVVGDSGGRRGRRSPDQCSSTTRSPSSTRWWRW